MSKNIDEVLVAKVSSRSPLTNKLAEARSSALTLVDNSPLRRAENVIVARSGPLNGSVVGELQNGLNYDIIVTFYNPSVSETQQITSSGVLVELEHLQSQGGTPFNITARPTDVVVTPNVHYPGQAEKITFTVKVTNVISARGAYRFILKNGSTSAELIRSEQFYQLLRWEWALKAGDHLTMDLIGGGGMGGGWSAGGGINVGAPGSHFSFLFNHYNIGPQASNQNEVKTRMENLSTNYQIYVGGGYTNGTYGVTGDVGGKVTRNDTLNDLFDFESTNQADNRYWNGVNGANNNGRLGGVNTLYPTLGVGGNGANSAGDWGGGGAGGILEARIKVKDTVEGVILFLSNGNVFNTGLPNSAPAGATEGKAGRGLLTFERSTPEFPGNSTFNFANHYA